ncbi:MAG TPA: hypothetical protein VFP22_00470, partial [Candidatus Limnocylindrales bacterium]|nr:hypothetical protein [Candidatus Limnocylindrales bacterium]
LAGRPAYDAPTPVALAEAHQAGPSPITGIPAALDAAVRRGLATDPAERPAGVRDFAAELRAALPGEPATAVTAAIPVVVATEPGRGAVATAARPERGRRSITSVPAPLVAVLGIALAAGLLLAATGADPSHVGTGPAASHATAKPTAEPTPTPTPVPVPPAPRVGPKGGDGGKGGGHGHGHGGGKGPNG